MKLEDKCKRYIIIRLLNVYCEIFGTQASSCVLRHMNSCRIFHNIGIKHGFPCNDVCQVPRESPEGPGKC